MVVVRGGPDTADKLARHAVRTNRAYHLDGQPFWRVSVFLALDELGDTSLDGLLSGRLRTYRIVHTPTLEQVRAAGCEVLPTFHPPHLTLVVPDATPTTFEQLLSASAQACRTRIMSGGRRR